MTPLLLVAVALGAAAAAVAVWVARRRSASRAEREAMARRLARAYAPVDVAEPMVPLRAPEGRVAVLPDGLALALGQGAQVHLVPWSGVHRITPVPDGTFSIRIVRVGTVETPGALGRSLWDAFRARREPPVPAPAERARPGRV